MYFNDTPSSNRRLRCAPSDPVANVMSSPDRDIKPNVSPEPLLPVKKGIACICSTTTRVYSPSFAPSPRSARSKTKKSPSKAGGRSVKTEITGTDESGFKPTSKDMAYHFVMHALDKVTIETRKEIAQKLGVKQKNLDAVSRVDVSLVLVQHCLSQDSSS